MNLLSVGVKSNYPLKITVKIFSVELVLQRRSLRHCLQYICSKLNPEDFISKNMLPPHKS